MRASIWLLLCVSLFVVPAFAQTIEFSVSSNDVDINETVRATIVISGSSWNGNVNMEWVEDFTIVNRATSNNVQLINWERNQVTTMTLDLQPKSSGSYTLGPAHLNIAWEWRVASSESLDIGVSWEKLFVWWTPQWRKADSPISSITSNQPVEAEKKVVRIPWKQLLTILWAVLLLWLLTKFLKTVRLKPKKNKLDIEILPQRSIQTVDTTYDTSLFIPQQSEDMNQENILKEHAAVLQSVMDEVAKTVVGQQRLIRNLLIALVSQGHILLEWVPGLAKTLSVETLSKVAGIAFGRVQFTPDLLPSDLTGTKVFDQKTTEFTTKKWPIFTNLLLADEINRAPAKVQSALLEAMAEKQVTIGDERLKLDSPFVVMATQNPLEQEGTYSLPEAQLDRFLLKTVIGYPTQEEEIMIMKQETGLESASLKKVLTKKKIAELQWAATSISVAEWIYTYVKNIVVATREPEANNCGDLAEYISFGVSPRASLALIKAAKVLALMEGRSYVLPEDIKEIAHDVLRHRIILSFQAIADGVTADSLIDTLLERIPVVA